MSSVDHRSVLVYVKRLSESFILRLSAMPTARSKSGSISGRFLSGKFVKWIVSPLVQPPPLRELDSGPIPRLLTTILGLGRNLLLQDDL